jgi:hypothetical protein
VSPPSALRRAGSGPPGGRVLSRSARDWPPGSPAPRRRWN